MNKMMMLAKMKALKELAKKMQGMEAKGHMEEESPEEESKESPLEEFLEPDMEDSEEKYKMGSMEDLEGKEPSFEDEKKSFMSRGGSSPIKGKTKSVMMAIAVKPAMKSKAFKKS